MSQAVLTADEQRRLARRGAVRPRGLAGLPPGTIKYTAIYAVLGVYCAFSVVVFFWVVLNATKTNTELLLFPPWHLPKAIEWQNARDAWNRGLGTMFRNSLIVAGFGTLGSVALA